jgi:hypothetical protein
MNYSIAAALDAQRIAAQAWQGERGVEAALNLYAGLFRVDLRHMEPKQLEWFRGPEAAADMASIMVRARTEIEDARVYVVADNIAHGLAQAQASLPPTVPFGTSMLPCPLGLAYLEGDHLHIPHPDRPQGDIVRMIVWGSGPTMPTTEQDEALQMPAHLRVTCWVDRGGKLTWRQNLLVAEGLEWSRATNQIEFTGDRDKIRATTDEATDASTTVIRYLLALGAFVSEKVVAVDRVRADRVDRRRAQKAGLPEPPPVNVLTMRELIHLQADRRGLADDVEWSCSWLVHSHWRNQWHPSTGDHALKWIRTHIKGDRSKPLHVSKPTVRYVKR